MPWMHPDANAYLESLLQPDFRVLEHGSGGSTRWFAERVAEVVSVEFRLSWYEALQELIPENVVLIHWTDVPPPEFKPQIFDLLLVDGNPHEHRNYYLDNAEQYVRPGGYVVLDNANRPMCAEARLRLMGRATQLERFERNMPFSKYFVTEFYQLRHSTGQDGRGHEGRQEPE